MKNVIISAIASLSLMVIAGCTQTEQRVAGGAAIGAGTGALIGAATGGGGSRRAARGALIGGAAGALIGAATAPGYCRYRDRRTGEIYEARCN